MSFGSGGRVAPHAIDASSTIQITVIKTLIVFILILLSLLFVFFPLPGVVLVVPGAPRMCSRNVSAAGRRPRRVDFTLLAEQIRARHWQVSPRPALDGDYLLLELRFSPDVEVENLDQNLPAARGAAHALAAFWQDLAGTLHLDFVRFASV
jgi:hypothetical protein